MLIEMHGITKKYRGMNGSSDLHVLNGIDLMIDQGDMIAIKGASGAGKSTLLHILGCLDKPTDGTYLLEGKNMGTESPSKLASIRNKKIGFVMQHFALIEEDDVLRNVGDPLLFSKTTMSLIDVLAMEQLRRIGIDRLAKKRVAKLSGGEKQRVAIARALVCDPNVILADEPTGALDKKNAAMILDLFCDLNTQGKTIIIVTHDEQVARACKRVITISDGIIC